MSRVPLNSLRTAAIVVFAACGDAPTAVPEHPRVVHGLDLLLPALDRAALVALDTSDAAVGVSVPAGAEIAPSELPETNTELPPPDAVSAIRDARTNVRFDPGYGQATGQHWYQGNKSRIDTAVTVAFDGSPLGSQSAFREQDAWYWLDFGEWKHIFANARFYSDRTCGLSAWGNSGHRAWWEAPIPPAVARYGESSVSSVSDVARQPECPTEDYGFVGGGSSVLCYFWIEYDEYTGDVYSVDFMYCEGLGG